MRIGNWRLAACLGISGRISTPETLDRIQSRITTPDAERLKRPLEDSPEGSAKRRAEPVRKLRELWPPRRAG